MQTTEALPLSSLQIGDASPFGNYRIYPLFLKEEFHPSYATLLSHGIGEKVKISEQESARIARVEISNRAKVPVLIPNGQALIGAKQNRSANRDYLIRAGSSSSIEVSCTEKGRWSMSGTGEFAAIADLDPIWMKKVKIEEINKVDDRRANIIASPLAMQRKIWDSVEEKCKKGKVDSRSSALHDVIRKQILIPGLKTGQEGVLVTHRDRVIGLECLSGPENYALYHRAIVTSLTFEHFKMDPTPEESQTDCGREWLESLNDMTFIRSKAINTGEHYLLSGKKKEGEMTLLNGTAIHISVINLPAA